MNTAILVRVSTVKQENDRQIHELTKVAADKNWTVIEIVEEQVSGNASNRAGLDRIMELARGGLIQKVLVHEVSRVARRNGVAHVFLDELCDLGVSLYWHTQAIETLLPSGKRNPAAGIMFSLLSEMARNERETLRERILSGLAEARRKGRKLGRPEGKESTATILSRHPDIISHLNRGRSLRQINRLTGKSQTTVLKVKRLLATK